MFVLTSVQPVLTVVGNTRSFIAVYELSGRLRQYLSEAKLGPLVRSEFDSGGLTVTAVRIVPLEQPSVCEVWVEGDVSNPSASPEAEAERFASGMQLLMPFTHGKTSGSADWIGARLKRSIRGLEVPMTLRKWLLEWRRNVRAGSGAIGGPGDIHRLETELWRIADRLALLDRLWPTTHAA